MNKQEQEEVKFTIPSPFLIIIQINARSDTKSDDQPFDIYPHHSTSIILNSSKHTETITNNQKHKRFSLFLVLASLRKFNKVNCPSFTYKNTLMEPTQTNC